MEQIFDASEVRAALGSDDVKYRGTGSFGEVWQSSYEAGTAGFKIIHTDGYETERLKREIEGYKRVASDNVVKLFDVQTPTFFGAAGTSYGDGLTASPVGPSRKRQGRLRSSTDVRGRKIWCRLHFPLPQAKQFFDTGKQSRHPEGFREDSTGTGCQQLIRELAASSKHENRRRAEDPELADNFQAADVGEAEIQDHDTGRRLLHRGDTLNTCLRQPDGGQP